MPETYSVIGTPKLDSPQKILCGPARHPLKVKGQFASNFRHNNNSTVQTVFVVDKLKTNLLGLPAIMAMNVVARSDSVVANPTEKWRGKFPSVFSGLGTLGNEYEIKLKPDTKQYSLYTARHVPLPLRSKVLQELQKMEAQGVISKVDKPTPWCAGMVVVPKKDGSIRICVDLKPLNVNVMREVHPLPTVDDSLAQLAGAKLFTKLDAKSGFWQVPLSEI